MHKHFSKKIVTILLMGVILTGCAKKSTDIVLTEPDTAVCDAGQDKGSGEDNEVAGTASSAEDKSAANEDTPVNAAEADKNNEVQAMPETIMVHVCGAVLCEGVYELPAGSRVVDAIKAAGGFLQDADSDYINQALVLEDGVKIKIPTVEESLAEADSGQGGMVSAGEDTAGITGMSSNDGGTASTNGKVNINTASETDLCSIPGIGPSRAKNIIAYREQNGKFGTIEDIMKVTGIKDKFFSKIKDHITV